MKNSNDLLKNMKASVNFGFFMGNKRKSDLSIFCLSKDSLTDQGIKDLKFYMENEFVEIAKNGWYCFTKKAMSF